MYLAALQAVFYQLGSFGCWAQVISRCSADLTQLLFAQMGSALLSFHLRKISTQYLTFQGGCFLPPSNKNLAKI
jgi:hypothetical protein